MDTVAVLTRIQSSGLTLRASGDRLVIDSTNPLTEQQRQFIRQHKASIIKALAATPSQPTATAGATPVALATAVTEALPTCTELSEPEPKERRCYQCEHFARSPYGYPLGVCRQHGLPEGAFSDARGNRLQHTDSRPTQFGCISFELRAPDTNLCTVCRSYNPASTMCRVVNTGCPSPAIPPCNGAHFEAVEVAS